MSAAQDVLVIAFLVLGGGVGTVFGWRAWTGRWRGWVAQGLGHRVLPMVAVGPTLIAVGLLLALAALGERVPSLPGFMEPVGSGLVVVVLLGGLASLGMILAAIFLGDRWYPRWYHQLPEDQRER